MTHLLGRRLLAAAALSTLLAALTGPASAVAAPPALPHLLPGDAVAASTRADARTWIVGSRPVAASARIARRHGARAIGDGTWEVDRGRARRLAAALDRAGLLTYSEPNRLAQRRRVGADPLSPHAGWRDLVADPSLTPPPVTPESPLLALIDSPLDPAHPEVAGSNIGTTGGQPLTDSHGTATATVAAAPRNGIGMVGIWPNMRALNLPLPRQIRCSDSARQINAAVAASAKVINMSYGSVSPCFAEYEQLQRATRAGVTLVAAAGNEFGEGNPLEFPASLPHVLTVAAIDRDFEASYFSNANAAVDLSAPGEGVVTAVPLAFDGDGDGDGYEALSGTSFAAPMVAAVAAWVRAARPDLSPDQVAQVVRLGARDVGRRGWDPSTGFGVASVAGALARKAPPQDPAEPNDDIVWVDGRAFGSAAPRLWRGRGVAKRFGMLDRYEDPVDVFRVTLPPRSRTRVTVRPRGGDPDVAVVPGNAERLFGAKLLARSRKAGRRTDAVTVSNGRSRSRHVYVAAYVHAGGRSLDAAYDLTVRRSR